MVDSPSQTSGTYLAPLLENQPSIIRGRLNFDKVVEGVKHLYSLIPLKTTCILCAV